MARRERRREYQSERTISKAGKNPDILVDYGNTSQANKRPDDLSRISGGSGG